MTYDFSLFKTSINLSEYAASFGYEIDRTKSTKSSIAMKGANDKVIISKKGGKWVYFSVTDDGDKGNIVNFALNRTHKTLREVGAILNDWMGGGGTRPVLKCYASHVKEHEADPKRIKGMFNRYRISNAHPYLLERHISKETLSRARFKNRICADKYNNAIFPHFNHNGICGLEFKSHNKCIFARGSEKTFWRSNTVKGDDTLIISEAVIDALSYFDLYKTENAMFVATGGGMSPEQENVLKTFAENYSRLKTILIITDNDKAGDKLAMKIIALLDRLNLTADIKRHAPDQRGDDWNDVLTLKANERKRQTREKFEVAKVN